MSLRRRRVSSAIRGIEEDAADSLLDAVDNVKPAVLVEATLVSSVHESFLVEGLSSRLFVAEVCT